MTPGTFEVLRQHAKGIKAIPSTVAGPRRSKGRRDSRHPMTYSQPAAMNAMSAIFSGQKKTEPVPAAAPAECRCTRAESGSPRDSCRPPAHSAEVPAGHDWMRVVHCPAHYRQAPLRSNGFRSTRQPDRRANNLKYANDTKGIRARPFSGKTGNHRKTGFWPSGSDGRVSRIDRIGRTSDFGPRTSTAPVSCLLSLSPVPLPPVLPSSRPPSSVFPPVPQLCPLPSFLQVPSSAPDPPAAASLRIPFAPPDARGKIPLLPEALRIGLVFRRGRSIHARDRFPWLSRKSWRYLKCRIAPCAAEIGAPSIVCNPGEETDGRMRQKKRILRTAEFLIEHPPARSAHAR